MPNAADIEEKKLRFEKLKWKQETLLRTAEIKSKNFVAWGAVVFGPLAAALVAGVIGYYTSRTVEIAETARFDAQLARQADDESQRAKALELQAVLSAVTADGCVNQLSSVNVLLDAGIIVHFDQLRSGLERFRSNVSSNCN
ncbi:MAG: hypothetical protein AAFQ15_06470 [Pseudomonadota bacterium]